VHVKRAGVAAVVALAIAVVAGCMGTADPEDAERLPLSAELLQYRRDQADRVVEVKLHNDSDRTVDVSRLELLTPRFAGSAPVKPALTLAGRDTVDVRVPLRDSVCGDFQTGPAVVRIWSADDDTHVDLSVAGSDEVLEKIRAQECATEAVLEAVPMTWTHWTSGGAGADSYAEAALRLGPASSGHGAVIESLEGTTLFAARATGLPVRLAMSGTVSVPVRFNPQRCDPHAVGESKRGYAFEVAVALDGAPESEAVRVTVSPDDNGRKLLESVLLEACSLTPPS
jgi:hypothetical protein